MTAQRATQESKLDEQQVMLDNREVIAPHDGYFVTRKNLVGPARRCGQHGVCRQQIRLASRTLPTWKPSFYVLESEAVGLADGQAVDIVIDAFPDRPLSGAIKSISATPHRH